LVNLNILCYTFTTKTSSPRGFNVSEFGYAGKILTVNLSNGKYREIDSAEYTERFLGGRGIAAKLYWDLVPPQTGAIEPDNCLICATGPVTGFFGLAGCRWVMGSKTLLHQPEAFSYGNSGSQWGSTLKYAGYDALVITGKAEKPVYLYIHDSTAEIKDASALWGLSTFDTQDKIKAEVGKESCVISIGPAAENLVVFATALADAGSSVSGGIGTIMSSKNLKAIAVAGNKKPKAAYPEKLEEIKTLVKKIRTSTFDAPSPWVIPGLTRQENCYGCGVGCSRQSYKGEDGRRYKSFCQASSIYTTHAIRYYGERNDVPLLAVRLCDGYGLDSAVMGPLISWLIECHREGVINEEQVGLPLSQAGSAEFIKELTKKIAFREGFGDALARGTLAAAATIGGKTEELTTRFIATQTSETKDYDPRLILTTALMIATEPRRPITQLHGISGNILISWYSWASKLEGSFFSTDDLRLAAERFWGSPKVVDFSTYDGKALAAKKVQDRSYAQESLVLCDVHWPMVVTSANNPSGHVGDPTLESQIFNAITGKETSEEELCGTGERIFNLQRAVQLRHGWNGRDGDRILEYYFTHPLEQGEIFFNPDAIMPGTDGKIISRLGAVLDRSEFEKMKDDYYTLRGWDKKTGFPTGAKLRELGLNDIIDDLEKRGLIVQ
jgi:aldehyde:ferredoxin oxidoreductase